MGVNYKGEEIPHLSQLGALFIYFSVRFRAHSLIYH